MVLCLQYTAFCWKISPYIYHSTDLMVSNFFHSMGIPCSLYTDDRHNGQLQISPKQGASASFRSLDEHNLAGAKSPIFLVAYFLIKLGYFLGLPKSVLMPCKVAPYLDYLSDSFQEVLVLSLRRRRNFRILFNRF